MSARIFVFDLTFSFEKNPSKDLIISFFKNNCKKWCIQLEKGNTTGYMHWQCRISLNEKKRPTALFKNIVEAGLVISTDAISQTSNNCSSGDNFWEYCTKDHTREEGPWSSRDAPLTRQMVMFDTWGLRPWQQELKTKAGEFCLRTIDLIYDIDGNNGKSLFSEHMEYLNLAEEVPPFRLMDDIFQWVASRPIKPCYIFDLPRGMKKDKLGDFYSGIEVIKNGVAYDKRYTAEKIRFNRPRVFVFTNTLPEFSLMSKDRWKVWTLYENQLKEFTLDEELFTLAE